MSDEGGGDVMSAFDIDAHWKRVASEFDLQSAIASHLNEPKHWWKSRAAWGAIATLIASLAGLLGYAIDQEQLTEVLFLIATAIGGILSLIGTIQRTAPIEKRLLPRARKD